MLYWTAVLFWSRGVLHPAVSARSERHCSEGEQERGGWFGCGSCTSDFDRSECHRAVPIVAFSGCYFSSHFETLLSFGGLFPPNDSGTNLACDFGMTRCEVEAEWCPVERGDICRNRPRGRVERPSVYEQSDVDPVEAEPFPYRSGHLDAACACAEREREDSRLNVVT